ncbi:MAG: hypothetical protein UY70_C0031G0004 [Candidatus Kaiserbacteria bacterium GW2011_GWB1_52_6]|uniref:Transmembrane protein n=3 Tax=Candidatus Kaiseribacteriota TaxID=1752734 RepID=A0A0G1XL77_9BACT|nr:MAG: hypothetical protein UY67_C0001G0018 [Candidatus Kaiserbacteria bacterium GW2011_GWA2_52_12]KKW26234.1 MAG: hypothetical protein UY70_C0031G0004 [Candidatus Kaiserbacteria bacterium GW2011_GWB1_52_6]KKW32043.1 MAG: hypothetical protein UY74_C0001G0016 [Candidatus Kaiserbacteria bacterium GW2011_GWC2_52_8b]
MNGIFSRHYFTSFLAFLCAVVIVVFVLAPVAARAQTGSQDIGTAIRAALFSDSRAAQMSPQQFDAVVAALTSEAVKQGMTAHDITWNMVASAVDFAEAACDSYLCTLNDAFGFSGSNMMIPIGLGFSSALLLLIIGTMRGMHRTPAVPPSVARAPVQ